MIRCLHDLEGLTLPYSGPRGSVSGALLGGDLCFLDVSHLPSIAKTSQDVSSRPWGPRLVTCTYCDPLSCAGSNHVYIDLCPHPCFLRTGLDDWPLGGQICEPSLALLP